MHNTAIKSNFFDVDIFKVYLFLDICSIVVIHFCPTSALYWGGELVFSFFIVKESAADQTSGSCSLTLKGVSS